MKRQRKILEMDDGKVYSLIEYIQYVLNLTVNNKSKLCSIDEKISMFIKLEEEE